ncbi:MAG: Bor family protein [Candidatus Longimicrobiales bacterium M2_2A_002]
MKVRSFAVLTLVFVLAGCYHATIETDRTPSAKAVENAWAHSFLYGLVPPSTVNVASECSNGVARVETQLSFLNMVANAVTFGIYSPMHITVTCAVGSAMTEDTNETAADVIEVEGAGHEALDAALNAAAVRSWQRLGAPVDVRLAN